MFRPLLKCAPKYHCPFYFSTLPIQPAQLPKPKPALVNGIVKNTVFVAPLSSRVDWKWLQTEIAELMELKDGDGIIQIRADHDLPGKKYGVGFIEFADEMLARRLLTCRGVKIDKLAVSFQPAERSITPAYQFKSKPTINTPSLTVYMNNLSLSTTEEKLKSIFSEVGQIVKIALPRQKDGTKVGNAFITFRDQESADRVVMKSEEEGGFVMNNRVIRVKYSNSQPMKSTKSKRGDSESRPNGKDVKDSRLEREKREMNANLRKKQGEERINEKVRIMTEEGANTDDKLGNQEKASTNVPLRPGEPRTKEQQKGRLSEELGLEKQEGETINHQLPTNDKRERVGH